MMRKLSIIFVMFFLISCSLKGKVYITCDDTCSDPVLFVDKEKIGVINELNDSGTYILYVDNGTRSIMIVNSDEKIYKTEINLRGEEYLFVSFKNKG